MITAESIAEKDMAISTPALIADSPAPEEDR